MRGQTRAPSCLDNRHLALVAGKPVHSHAAGQGTGRKALVNQSTRWRRSRLWASTKSNMVASISTSLKINPNKPDLTVRLPASENPISTARAITSNTAPHCAFIHNPSAANSREMESTVSRMKPVGPSVVSGLSGAPVTPKRRAASLNPRKRLITASTRAYMPVGSILKSIAESPSETSANVIWSSRASQQVSTQLHPHLFKIATSQTFGCGTGALCTASRALLNIDCICLWESEA